MKVFLLAGEPSGDRLGAALMDGLRQLRPDTAFDGIGGPDMTARGLASRFDMAELSVMGLAEIVPRYPALRRRMIETAAAILAAPPDVVVTIDVPDFALRVLRRVRAANPAIRTVHYVAPSVWAWRPGRAARMAGIVDQVLTLLPFEPPYLARHGIRADFVGHPVAAEPVAAPEEIAAFRAAHGLDGARLLLVLPGSRRAEVQRLAPIFGAALVPVLAQRPDLRVVVPAAAPVADLVRTMTARWPGRPVVLDGRSGGPSEKRAAFAAATAALAASGTVSLELAAAGTPMVIAYDMAWLSRRILGALLRVDTVTLVNLVSETRAVPEFLGDDCRPEPIAGALLHLLGDPRAQDAALALTMERLGRGGEAPGLRAARAVLDGLDGLGR